MLRSASEPDKDKGEALLTASPLDYHVFRQEITSKYPAFSPPPPLVPLEINNNSILPPLPNDLSRNTSHDSLGSLGAPLGNGAVGRSIFHQPVHISTPAPSPPPSPAGPGGKGGKKQNYQTNQNFPFLYPPLDSSSNDLGGKGRAELQDKLVGKRWEGSDIPASILEAAQLFASRMRMSRPLRQLWEAREEFIKHDRGWHEESKAANGVNGHVADDEQDETSSFELSSDEDEPSDESKEVPSTSDSSPSKTERETDNPTVQERLETIELFYVSSKRPRAFSIANPTQRTTLPHLQSIVIVLLKVLLSNLSAAGSQSHEPKGPAEAFDYHSDHEESNELAQSNINLARNLSNLSAGQREDSNMTDRPLHDLNATRTREITSKAISGLLLMLLKWFRLSRKCPWHSLLSHELTSGRHLKVRISQRAAPGLKLHSPRPQVLCPARHRQGR